MSGVPTGGARPTTSHWGAYSVRPRTDGGLDIRPHPEDPSPSPLLGNVEGALRHATRVRRPAVRRPVPAPRLLHP